VVNGVGVLGNLDPSTRQLHAKAYRPRAGGPRAPGELFDSLAKLLRGEDERLPKAFASGGIKSGKDLTTARVEDRQGFAVAYFGQRSTEGIQGAHPDRGDSGAGGQPTRGREADADADERARTAADRESAHRVPATAGLNSPLDLGQQGSRVTRATFGREPEQLLVQDLAAARRADGRIRGRRVETDDRLPLGAQVSQ
jgi:hypothetical protein